MRREIGIASWNRNHPARQDVSVILLLYSESINIVTHITLLRRYGISKLISD